MLPLIWARCSPIGSDTARKLKRRWRRPPQRVGDRNQTLPCICLSCLANCSGLVRITGRHVIDLIVAKGSGGAEHLSPEERLVWGTEFMDRRAATGLPFIWVGLHSAIAGSHDTLILPKDVTQPDWELELAVVIGKAARRVALADALDHVAGYTIANDVTARELVDRPDIPQMGMDWMRCKNAPGFNILGPYITPARFVADPQKLHIKLSLNGQVMQDEGTDDMIFGVARLIEFASAHTPAQSRRYHHDRIAFGQWHPPRALAAGRRCHDGRDFGAGGATE